MFPPRTPYAESSGHPIAYQVCGQCEQQFPGIAMHVGSGVAERATPGEGPVSDTVRDLVAGSGLGFAERGAHELRANSGNYGLFAVT